MLFVLRCPLSTLAPICCAILCPCQWILHVEAPRPAAALLWALLVVRTEMLIHDILNLVDEGVFSFVDLDWEHGAKLFA